MHEDPYSDRDRGRGGDFSGLTDPRKSVEQSSVGDGVLSGLYARGRDAELMSDKDVDPELLGKWQTKTNSRTLGGDRRGTGTGPDDELESVTM